MWFDSHSFTGFTISRICWSGELASEHFEDNARGQGYFPRCANFEQSEVSLSPVVSP